MRGRVHHLIGCLFACASTAQAATDGNAGSLVGGITAEQTAAAEVKTPEPSPTPSRSWLSNLEVTGGSDRLVILGGQRRQASLFGEVRYRLNKILQIGSSITLRFQGNDSSTETAVQTLFGPTFNFGDAKLNRAFFLSPKVGMTTAWTSGDDLQTRSSSGFTWSLSFGKRFAISDHVAFAPSVGLIGTRGQPASSVIQPVAFSILF